MLTQVSSGLKGDMSANDATDTWSSCCIGVLIFVLILLLILILVL